MENYNKQQWEDLNLSRDELKSIGEALKKEEFRNLLIDYVKEINDPENRKQYENEITQLENERGVDIKFVNPSAGYVIKTSVEGKIKAFINICSNTNVGKPSSTPDIDQGCKGLRWSIPHCLAPPREDADKKNNACTVYDVVFHPDTLHISKKNSAFKKLVEDTALGAVEEAFHVSLDKINLKYPKMHFKGAKHATVIRKRIKDFQPTEVPDIPNYPYPPVKEEGELKNASSFQKNNKSDDIKSMKSKEYTKPKYTIKYRSNVDMQDYTNDPMAKLSITIPSEIVIVIDLPLLKHSSDASIDVTEKSVYLISERPAKYKLNLNLPYTVDSNKGNAKFDTIKRTLIITLPVIKQKYKHSSKTDLTREDSGVESDICNGRSNSVSSSDEDGTENETVVGLNDSTDENTLVCDQEYHNSKTITKQGQKFLKPNVHYLLPNYKCQLFKDVLNVTLQVSNVNPESVEYSFIENLSFSGFHISLISTGCGFFPVNYAICVFLPSPSKIDKETFNVEVWDNNVIIQMKLICYEDLIKTGYYVGSEENNIEKVTLEATDSFDSLNEKNESSPQSATSTNENHFINQKLNLEKCEAESSPGLTLINAKCLPNTVVEENALINCQQLESQSQDEENDCFSSEDGKKENNESEDNTFEEDEDISVSEEGLSYDESGSSPQRYSTKSRTMSESQESFIMRSKKRGILKIGRSLSESNVDDYDSWSTEREKTKKTVRFSDVVSKQVFRTNSSILGQRKKNQRKMRNKKRAQERRLSESGNESEGENEVMVVKEKGSNCMSEIDVWFKDPESSSCDVSEVSEVSDVSESDDGQKEDVKRFTPCSSKKNHKRRGKKSARKNAATAKFQFMEN